MYNIKFIFYLFLFCLVLFNCTGQTDSQDTINIGAIVSETGPAAAYGIDNRLGLETAVSVINGSGGINGKMINLQIEDSGSDAATAVALLKRFASDKSILAILGPTRTGSTVSCAALLDELKIPLISVGSTGDWFSASKGEYNDWTFRSTRVDSDNIPYLIKALKEKYGVNKTAIIYMSDDDWSVSVLEVYRRSLDEHDMEIIAVESHTSNTTDYRPILTKIKSMEPELLIINSLSAYAPLIASSAREIGISAQFAGTAGFTNKSTFSTARFNALEGVLLTENYFSKSDRPAVLTFISAFQAINGQDLVPPPYSAYAYDGCMILADAIGRAEEMTREAIRRAIASTTDFEGVLGNLTYTGSGDSKKIPVLLEIREGEYIQIPFEK